MAAYEKVFTKPYENGYVDLPNQTTPITAETLNDKDTAIEHIEDFLNGQEFVPVPTALADLTDDSTHRLVTDTEKSTWNAKVGADSYDEKTINVGQFETISGGKLGSCIVAFEPVQSGSGTPSPDNVRPITGHTSGEVLNTGKNILSRPYSFEIIGQTSRGGVNYQINDDGSLTLTGKRTSGQSATYVFLDNAQTPNALNHLIGVPIILRGTVSNICNIQFWTANGNKTIASDTVFTLTAEDLATTWNVEGAVQYTDSNLNNTVYPMICLATETDTTYEPYNGQDITIQFGNTYYGGTLDFVSGVLTVDRVLVTMGDFNWTTSMAGGNVVFKTQTALPNVKILTTARQTNGISSAYEFSNTANDKTCFIYNADGCLYVRDTSYSTASDFKTGVSDVQVCYEINPTTIQLSPSQINTLVGQNNLSAPLDGQSIQSAQYRELFVWDDVEDVVELRLPISAIGTDESNNDTASQAYSQGDYFYKNGIAKAKTSIASGATFTLGTNYEIKTLAEILKALES